MDKRVITESLVYIEKNITCKLNIEEIANEAGYSRFHFARAFKQEMNISVMEYVKERKIVCASESILRGDKILDVAIEYGWESHNGFIKAFKSYYGFSPSLLYAMNLEINRLGGKDMRCYAFYEKTEEHMSKEDLFKLLEEKMIENEMDITELRDVFSFQLPKVNPAIYDNHDDRISSKYSTIGFKNIN